MITLEEKIARTQRLLRRLEEDQPYLHVRLSALGAEHRQSANAFADRVRAEAHALAAEIAVSAPLAVRSIRATMRGDLAGRIRAATDREAAEQGRLLGTADFREGVRAMAERRPPRFEGR